MRDYIAPDQASHAKAGNPFRFLTQSTSSLTGLRSRMDQLSALAEQARLILPASAAPELSALLKRLAGFSAPITFAGQVKAGKTALVNVLAGSPGLLPSDVNPWTSVVTTLHLNTPRPANVRADFAFFEPDEWEVLIRQGGRLGQLAQRARAEDELLQIRAQIEDMYLKSRARLGRNFEMLLGNRHKYDSYSKALIERYVCLGDQYGGEDKSAGQGRFADITRSADLYLDMPGYPVGLSLQDTPGVNDPFLMREQVTLRSMNEASLCVVVLSAAQAMNTVDLALIQLLCALESRRVILFVNRCDELKDPARDMAEIREGLERILQNRGMGDLNAIVFGSALWAEAALAGEPSLLSPASHAALATLSGFDGDLPAGAFADAAWQHSGLGALLSAIGATINRTSGAELVEDVWRRLSNLITRYRGSQAETRLPAALTPDETRAKMASLRSAVEGYISNEMAVFLARLTVKVQQASAEYVTRMAQALLERAQENGHAGVENCDPMHLRIRLRSAYLRYCTELRGFFQEISEGMTEAMADLFSQMLGPEAADLQLYPPVAPRPQPPAALGRTIVVDLQTTRWKAWMASHVTSKGLAREYHSLVEAEVKSVSDELLAAARQTLERMAADLRAFLDEQEHFALALASGESGGLQGTGGLQAKGAARPGSGAAGDLTKLSQELALLQPPGGHSAPAPPPARPPPEEEGATGPDPAVAAR